MYRIAGIVVAACAVMLSGQAAVAQEKLKDDEPKKVTEAADIIGKITKVNKIRSLAMIRQGIFRVIKVEGKKTDETRFEQAWVNIRKETGVYIKRKGGKFEKASFRDLNEGLKVSVRFQTVLPSNPAQGIALQVIIHDPENKVVLSKPGKSITDKKIDIIGTITKVNKVRSIDLIRQGVHRIVLVEGKKSDDTRYDKAWVKIRQDTAIYFGETAQTGAKKGTFKDLNVGTKVKMLFASGVLPANPVQANAVQVNILDTPKQEEPKKAPPKGKGEEKKPG